MNQPGPPEVVSAVQAPLSDPQAARLSFDHLGIVEETVEDLPEKDDGHEDQINTSENKDVGLQGICQLLSSVDSLEILSKMPLVKGGLSIKTLNTDPK